MTIINLDMRRLAEEQCLGILRQASVLIEGWIADLKNTGIDIWVSLPFESGTVLSLAMMHDQMKERRDKLRDWRDNYGQDITARYGSDYKTSLDGAITSFSNMLSHISTLVQAEYWDATSGEPVIGKVTQTDRDTLASDFEDELPVSQVLACTPSFTLSITADMTIG